MNKNVVINDSTVLHVSDGKTLVINEDTAFIIDKSVLNIFFSINHPSLHHLDYFFAYLDHLHPDRENRKAIVLDSLSKVVIEKIKDKELSKSYYEGHCNSSSKFIGEQKNEDKVEILALVNHLVKRYTSVFLISEELCFDQEFIVGLPQRSKIVNLQELKCILVAIPNFAKYVDTLFNSSA